MSESILASLQSDSIVGPDRHRFRLSKNLGQHPYGTLWLAEDLATSAKTEVMLLFLPDLVTQQTSTLEELKKLVILSRKCKHPNALTCYGLFAHKGALFIAFEAMDGLTLDKMLDQNQAQKLKPEQKQGLVIQAGKAIDAFHKETRKHHSSLAPEVVFISASKGVRVMMLGWRYLVDELLDLLPNPPRYRQYQAPEGFDPLPTTQRSDVYAFASMIYHLYAGKPAFLPQDDEKSRYQRELKAPNGLDARQWQVLQTALTPDPESRPASILQLLKQLYVDESSTPEEESPTPELSQPTQVDMASPNPSDKDSPRKYMIPYGHLAHFLRHGSTKVMMPIIFVAGLLLGLLIGHAFSPNLDEYQTEISRLEQLLSDLEQTQVSAVEPDELEPSPINDNDLNKGDAERATEELSTPPAEPLPTNRQTLANQDVPENLIRFQDFFGDDLYAPLMQELPLGEFLMGDLNRIGDDNERPVREITFAYRFAIGVHEVTFAEYDQFAMATGRDLPDDAGWGRGDRPVINVSWEDARAYAQWLREVTGQPYRLPSEAEWEYAARAGTGSAWWWGNQLEPGMAVCDGCGTQWDGQQTAPVGQFPANAWGLKDMHGNVEEWVEDCYTDHYTSAPEDGSAMRSGNCHLRVLRGGSWFDIPRVIRSSSRYRQELDARQNTYGFRVAVDLPLTP